MSFMGKLRDHEFKSSYHKLNDDVAKEFYLPCMRNASVYKRISGYFGSTIYIIAWSALKEFISNNGHMQLLCSPYLTGEDAEAIREGKAALTDEVLAKSFQKELSELMEQENVSSAAKLFACLIANKIIEIKLVIARDDKRKDPNIERLYHDKAGIFIDRDGDSVAFRGSINETFKGLSDNGNIESVDVFQSWDGGKDAQRSNEILAGFDRVWNGGYDVLEIHDLPETAAKYIRDKTADYHWEQLLDEVKVVVNKAEKWRPNKSSDVIKLKDHQVDALEGWEQADYRAIYQGCTGCGKTVIAISAIRHEIERGKKVLVLVPSKELLANWDKEIRRIITDININIFLCGDGNNAWKNNGNLSLWTSPSGSINNIVIAIMDTTAKPEFISAVNDGEHLFVVADEVHNMGSPTHRRIFALNYGSALGLSATPERFGDPEGTQSIIDYFGAVLQPPYTLQTALREGVLTKYFYYPKRVVLTPDEQADWDELTKRISKRFAMSHGSVDAKKSEDAFLQHMMIERARILKKAANKVTTAIDILRKNYKEGQKWLVYCEDKTQLQTVLTAIRNEGIDAYAYYADMSGDREGTLSYFAENGGVIVSIKCLDEGVDIPSTTHALILASSKNPREFIQRRGRILRKSDGKNLSFLYDAIVVPHESSVQEDKSLSIVVSELGRAIEFGESSISSACITDLKVIALRFGVNYNELINEGYEEDEE